MLLGVVLINTASISELSNYSDRSHRWSWWIAVCMLLFATLAFGLTLLFVATFKTNKQLSDSAVFSALTNGLNTTSICKYYSLVFVLHRVAIVMFMMVDMGFSTKLKLA